MTSNPNAPQHDWGGQNTFVHHDFRGDNPKYRCINPRTWSTRRKFLDETSHHIPEGFVIKYEARCGKCVPCLNQRRAKRSARAMNEVETSLRTWFDTRGFGVANYLRFLADRGDPAALSILEHGFPSPGAKARWERNAIGKIVTDYVKRIRKAGHKLRCSKHWEKGEEGGHDHCHLLIHEIEKPILLRQLQIAAFIQPRGYQLPERRPRDTDDKYYARILHQLWDGWKEWMHLAKDTSDAARERRKQLPFQTGMTGAPKDRKTGRRRKVTTCIRDNTRNRVRNGKRAVFYCAKAAAYSAKSGGRWSASPGYGKPFQGMRMNTRENRNRALAAMAALWLTVASIAHAAGPGSHDPHKGAASCPSGQDGLHHSPGWCRLAASSQEDGPNGPPTSPLAPPKTGPPTGPPTTQPEHQTLWAQYLAQYYTDGGSTFPPNR